jgi:death on curing protein
MRYVTLGEVVELLGAFFRQLVARRESGTSGRSSSLWPSPRPRSAVATCIPRSLAEKAAALCLALVQGHPFIDGNKRVGHAAMETFLVLNGTEINASTDEQERLILDLAGGRLDCSGLTDWLRHHLKPLG